MFILIFSQLNCTQVTMYDISIDKMQRFMPHHVLNRHINFIITEVD